MSAHISRRFAVPFLGLAVLLGSVAPAVAADTVWTGTAGASWAAAGNWSNGVPNSTTNAYTGGAGADIVLGAGAQAKTLFVEGPVGGESQLSSGTLTLSNQLWINVASGTADPTILRLYDGGSAPVSVTADKASIGVDPGQPGGVILDSRAGGSVTLSVVDTLTIGYDGSGSYVYSWPAIPTAGGAVSISAATIQTSVLATAGTATDGYNYIGTYTSGATLSATDLVMGVAGQQGGAENYGGNWTVGNTQVGVQAPATANYITVSDGGTFTNSGVFTVGVAGSGNNVYVGYAAGATSPTGTLAVTGPNDLVIGAAATADANRVTVDLGSALTVVKNVVVGIDGHSNSLIADNGSVLSSGGARVGVNAGSTDNFISVTGSSAWTMNGTVRVGDKGSSNAFFISNGGTVTLTGAGKNFYVGYDKSASNNALTVTGTGSTLAITGAGADLVISANVTGTGADSTGNVATVDYGGTIDTARTLVGAGGSIWGDGGTIMGDTLVGAGGTISPGHYGPNNIGGLSFTGNVDLSSGGALQATVGSGTAADFIDVGGLLTLGGTSALALDMTSADPFHPYVIARYGTLSGVFASITGLPAGALINYNYLGLNQIAVTTVPEIGTAATGTALALLGGVIGLSERRRRRRM